MYNKYWNVIKNLNRYFLSLLNCFDTGLNSKVVETFQLII